MKVIELCYQKNIRDIGGLIAFNGLKVKSGRIYRGGALSKVNDEDIDIINSLKLTDIVDFRSHLEFEARPDYRFKGVTFHNFPALIDEDNDQKRNNNNSDDSNLLWFLEDGMSGFEHMHNIYAITPLSKEGIKAYKNFFKVLLIDNKRVTYFHCSQGKDRAGMAAFLLEIALGVSEADARNDYLYTNVAMDQKIVQFKEMLKNKPYYDKEYEQSLIDVFSAKDEYLDAAIFAINLKYGSILNYIIEALEVDIDRLRAIYLE